MANYRRMTNAELITALHGLEAQMASLKSITAERDRLAHELSVHQIELEAQNLELREAQRLVEESRDRYADLFDFAPVGLATLDVYERIQEINLTGASMLGVERSRLVGMPLSLYLPRSDVDALHMHLRICGQSQQPVTCDLGMMVRKAAAIRVQLVSVALRDDAGRTSGYRLTMTDVTAYRRAEQALRESEEKYRRLHESLMDGFVYVDMTGRIVECNETYRQLLGYSQDELLKLTYHDITPQRWHAFEQDIVENEILPKGYSEVYRTEYRRKDGTLLPVELRTFLVKDEGGANQGMWALVRDIGERQRAEATLRGSEERFRAIFEQVAVGVAQCDSRTGEFIRVNQKYCDIVGYAREELLTRRCQDITHPDDLAAELDLMQQLKAGAIRTFALEKRLLRKDGEIVWINQTVSPLWANGGEPLHYIAITEDISERRQMREDTARRLAELEVVSKISTRLRSAPTLDQLLPLLLDLTLEALHTAQGSIWLYDDAEGMLRSAVSRRGSNEDGTRRDVLKPGDGIIGGIFLSGQPYLSGDSYSDQGAIEVMGQNMPQVVGGAAVPIHAGEMVIGVFVVNVPLPRKLTPSEQHLLTLLSDLAGTAVRRIQLRDEVEQRVVELEQRVIERTAELSEREAALEAANIQLKELDRMKSQFVSNVSHELRTPITTIKLYASLLRRGPPERRDEFLAALEREANRQARLIDGIMQVSRIESGRLDLQCAVQALNDLVVPSVASREALAAEKGVTLASSPLIPGPMVCVDRGRMLEVIDNLVENALWYTPSGGCVHVITGTAEADGRTWAMLSVADTGMGIPEDELPRIFDRFFRGERPQEMQLPGTGLGLAIVKDIVELHGGQVRVESQVGEGSAFTVWLPLA